MKIILFTLIFLCPFYIITQGQINYQVSFSSGIEITEATLDDGETYAQVKVSDTYVMDSVGFPALPVKYIKFIVPHGASEFNVVVNTTQKQNYKLNHKINPVPTGFYNKPDFVKPDEKKYNSNLPYPMKIAEVVESGYFRNSHLVTVAVYPCRYLPVKNELDYFETVELTLNYEENGKQAKGIPAISNEHRKIVEGIVENPSDIEKFSTGESIEQSTTITGDRGITVNCKYVVVTNENLEPAFNEFIAWKRRKGIDIELVTIEDIYANYTGDEISGINDNAGKLRQFLVDAYDSGNGIEYALLGGDNTVLPIRHRYDISNTTDSVHIIPTDLYFAEFDGDWKVDDDTLYGEPDPDSEINFFTDIYIGRIMVKNQDEVHNWTRKTILYEQNPGLGDNTYVTEAFFTQADDMQLNNQAREVLNYATWITDTVIYEESGGPNTTTTPNFPKGQDVIDEFNNHYGFTSFMAHGGPNNVAVATPGFNDCLDIGKYKLTSIDSNPALCEVSETGNGFDNMTNIDHPSINYSISCTTMPFDDYKMPANDRNMGEAFTCISNGGGPIYLGNTREGNSSSKNLFLNFIGVIRSGTSYSLGIAETISKINYSYDNYIRISHNLIGCPETEVWTSTPSVFTNASVTVNGNNVTVNTGGVIGSTICVMSAMDEGVGFHEVRPNVSSSTFYNVPSSYLVTITKHNYLPYLKDANTTYIQNEFLYAYRYISAQNIYAGEDVTILKPEGVVKIKNGANVIFDAGNDVYLEGGFEVEQGGRFEVK